MKDTGSSRTVSYCISHCWQRCAAKHKKKHRDQMVFSLNYLSHLCPAAARREQLGRQSKTLHREAENSL